MKKLTSIPLLLLSIIASAQGEMSNNDFFRSNLKIYVSVAVLFIILCCLFIFLFSLEKRLKNLEKKQP